MGASLVCGIVSYVFERSWLRGECWGLGSVVVVARVLFLFLAGELSFFIVLGS